MREREVVVLFINLHFFCCWNLIEDLCWPQGVASVQTVFCVSPKVCNELFIALVGVRERVAERGGQALTQFCSWQCSHKWNSHIFPFSVSSVEFPPSPLAVHKKNCSYNWRNNCKSRNGFRLSACQALSAGTAGSGGEGGGGRGNVSRLHLQHFPLLPSNIINSNWKVVPAAN